MTRLLLPAFLLLAACTPGLPLAPAAPTVTRQDAGRVSVLPNGPPGGQTATDVRYELRRGAPGGTKAFVTKVQIGVAVLDTLPGGSVAYVVVAVSPAGEAASPEAVVSGPPAKPTNLRYTAVTESLITLEWNADATAKSWNAFWAPNPGLASTGGAWGSVASEVTEPRLQFGPGQKMYISVQASNDAGQSPFSDEILYDPANPPTPVVDEPGPAGTGLANVVIVPGDARVVLRWSYPGAPPRSVRIYLDGNAFVTLPSSDTSATINDLPNESIHTIQLATVDAQGREGARTPEERVQPREITSISGQNSHFCALTKAGALYCWGSNATGETGATPGSEPGRAVWPRRFDENAREVPIRGAKQVVTGAGFSCAILQDGGVSCWGENGQGQRGDGGAGTFTTVGTRVKTDDAGPLHDVLSIGVGRGHACALDASRSVWCWGDNTFKQLGVGAGPSSSFVALRVSGTQPGGEWSNVQQLAVGDYNNCIVQGAGTVACWGTELYERDANQSIVNAGHETPVLKYATQGNPLIAQQLFNLAFATCAQTSSLGFVCWGSPQFTPGNVRENGTLINQQGLPEPTAVPLRGGGSLSANAMSWSWRQSCGLDGGTGRAWCWGDNARSLPSGDRQSWPVAFEIQPGAPTTYRHIASGDGVTCVVDKDGRLRCRGRNDVGQCGVAKGTSCDAGTDVPLPVGEE